MKRKRVAMLIMLLSLSLLIGTAAAQGPEMLTYSGIIPQGVNEGDGYYDITFSIYDTQAVGKPSGAKSRAYMYIGAPLQYTLEQCRGWTWPLIYPTGWG